jgi:hypothetical protein
MDINLALSEDFLCVTYTTDLSSGASGFPGNPDHHSSHVVRKAEGLLLLCVAFSDGVVMQLKE